MRWRPWQRETRQESSYSDALTRLIAEQSDDKTVKSAATGAMEACSGLVGRCFAAAKVEGPPMAQAALTPSVLTLIGRQLLRTGAYLGVIDVRDGRLQLLPAASWDVRGGYSPETWAYRVTLIGPDSQATLDPVAAEGVVHVLYSVEPGRPWLGQGPLQQATIAGRLSAEVGQALADEAAGPRGSLLPIPVDGEDPTVSGLKADIRKLKGNVALVESTAGSWATDAATQAPKGDWRVTRLGADPPAGLVSLSERAFAEVAAACGVPVALFDSRSDGTARREGFRQFLHGTLQPLAGVIEAEASEKLETPVKVDLAPLFAADLSGRARAFQSLVGGGMPVEKAASLAGLLAPE